MKSRQSFPRFQKVSVLIALFAVIGVGAGLTASSDAQLPPFNNNYGDDTGQLPTHAGRGPEVPTKGATKSARLSKHKTFTFAVGPFSEDVRGTVSFVTSKAIASKKAKLSFGKKSFRARSGTKARVKVKVGTRAGRVVKKNGKVRVIAKVAAKDSAGNRSSKSLAFTLKRAK